MFYLRDENIKLTADEKKLLAINCALFGTMRLFLLRLRPGGLPPVPQLA